MIKIENIKPGQVVWDCHRYKAGNTTARTWGNWSVHVIEVHDRFVVAKWNGNPPEKYYARAGKFPWFKEKPVLVKSGWFHRKETAAEKKARKAESALLAKEAK